MSFVSHIALIEQELEQRKRGGSSRQAREGSDLEGTVKNITTTVYSLTGGVDGFDPHHRPLLGRVSDPHEVVSLDQKINVVILDFDEEKKRIALGLKQLTHIHGMPRREPQGR